MRIREILYASDDGSGGTGNSGGAPSPSSTPGADSGGSQSASGKPWHEGVDPETFGHWQNKGWDISSPLKVATEATKAYREAEKFVGVPPNEIIRLPKPGDEAGAKAMWQRLGVPPDASGYDFSDVKFADGTGVDDAFANHMRGAFARLNVPKETATAVAREVVKFMENAEQNETAEHTLKVQQEQAALAKNWGPNMEANRFLAKLAAEKLGVTAADLDAMEKQIGGSRVLDIFRQIGANMGEGRYIANGGPQGNGVMTREQAIARRAELKADKDWSARYLAGDAAARREMTGLNTLIVGDDTEASRRF